VPSLNINEFMVSGWRPNWSGPSVFAAAALLPALGLGQMGSILESSGNSTVAIQPVKDQIYQCGLWRPKFSNSTVRAMLGSIWFPFLDQGF